MVIECLKFEQDEFSLFISLSSVTQSLSVMIVSLTIQARSDVE